MRELKELKVGDKVKILGKSVALCGRTGLESLERFGHELHSKVTITSMCNLYDDSNTIDYFLDNKSGCFHRRNLKKTGIEIW